jgi:phage shock protein PspC (stress-responsive transcriptional regulator)
MNRQNNNNYYAMKQVININFQGRVVPIEVTAFEILKKYTESLNRYFAMEEGKDEIINDIESRIGELFQERLKAGATCICDDDINAIIKSIGRPEDFETDQATAEAANESRGQAQAEQSVPYTATGAARRLYRDENHKVLGGVCSGLANYFNIDVVVVRIIFVVLLGVLLIPYIVLWVAVPSSATSEIGGVRKKLYRDSDDKIIAGVCSGIGNYFGINAWIPRILFLIPFLSYASRWGHWWGDFPDFLRVGFSPGALIIYIILWLVLPEALTTAEKLEMKGEKVDMNSIKNSVVEEMKGVQERAQKFGKEASAVAGEKAKAFSAEAGSIARRSGRSFGDIIALLFKIFAYFILGCIAFAFVVALFALGITAVGLFPVKDFVLTDGWQNAFAWGTLIFFIAVPIIGIITWLIRRLTKTKTNRKLMRISFFSLWLIGVFSFIALIASVARDFKSGNNLVEQEVFLSNPTVNRLEITSSIPNQKFYSNRWFRMEPFEGIDEDTAFVKNVSVHIVKSPNDSFRVTMMKMVRGSRKRYADTLAAMMNYNVVQQDSLLLVDKGIAITRKDKFRNQRIVLTVYVPVGKQIRVNRNAGWGNDFHFDGPFNNDWNIDFEDLENGWEPNVDYIMKETGLETLDGRPVDTWKHQNARGLIDVRDGDTRVRIDENGIIIEDGKGDNYRYDIKTPAGKIDSLKIRLEREQQRIKDSLEKVKEKIDNQLEKLDATTGKPTALVSYSIPAYNPMLILY